MGSKKKPSILARLQNKIKAFFNKDIDVYFVSGMCYNCTVFDGLILPDGYIKRYIEWKIPSKDESLDNYTQRMLRHVDTKRPFVLVGYSFGGVIVQEMTKFIQPQKVILISTFKRKEEIPALFRFARMTNVVDHLPMSVFSSTRFVTTGFNRIVYDLPTEELAKYMTVTNPTYVRWAVSQIVNWIPDKINYPQLYHIQGTKDQIFAFDKMKDVYPVPGGDHLMVLKHTDEVNNIIQIILSKKE